MRRAGVMLLVASAPLLLASCVVALHAYNQPSQQRIVVVAASPERYSVRIGVEGEPVIPVPASGRVLVDVPVLPRPCSHYFLGIIRTSDGLPERRKVIQFLRDGRIVRKLSLDDVARLPVDPEGWREVRLR